MVLILNTKGGGQLHGPPYTKAEERDFYKRIGGGPLTVARGRLVAERKEKPPTPEQARALRARRRRS